MSCLTRLFIPLLSAVLTLAVLVGCDGGGTAKLGPPDEVLEVDQAPAWSPDGRRIAYLHRAGPTEEDTTDVTGLYILDLEADTTRLVAEGLTLSPDWRPDGDRIAFATGNIYTINPNGSELRRVREIGGSFFPSWAPGGDRLAFDTSYRDENGAHVIWLMNPDGRNLKDISQHGVGEWRDPDWSPGGDKLVHLRFLEGVFGEEVFVMDSTGENAIRLTNNERNDRSPAWSPDGEWIAWSPITESGHYELWVMRADGSEQQKLLDGGRSPSWSPDSERLVFARPASDSRFTALWLVRRDGSGLRQLTFPASSNK